MTRIVHNGHRHQLTIGGAAFHPARPRRETRAATVWRLYDCYVRELSVQLD